MKRKRVIACMVIVLLGSDIAGCGYENSSGLNRAESIGKTDTENLVREEAVEETISLENEIEKNVETINIKKRVK